MPVVGLSSGKTVVVDAGAKTITINYGGPGGIQGAPGGDANHWAIQEVPTGDQDGSNQSFTLGNTPTGAVVCIYNGREMQNTVDYSYTGTALTLITFYPNASDGDRFWVRYPYA